MLQKTSEGAACLKAVDVASQDERAVDIDLRAFDVLYEQLMHLPGFTRGRGGGKGRGRKGRTS